MISASVWRFAQRHMAYNSGYPGPLATVCLVAGAQLARLHVHGMCYYYVRSVAAVFPITTMQQANDRAETPMLCLV